MSLLQQPDTTHIHRLTVRGPQGAQNNLLSQLEAGHWPAPRDGSWVLVRKVSAAASRSRLAGELMDRTQHLISQGDTSEVVRYPCLTALLAALIEDICKGVAQSRWYWQRWSRLWGLPRGDAIQQLMQEHPREFVGTCHQIAAQGNLRTVWQNLSPANAEAIFYTLAYELKLSPERFSQTHSEPPSTQTVLKIPPALVKRWQPILADLPVTDTRAKLAALMLATEHTALALQAEPAETLDSILRGVMATDTRATNSAYSPSIEQATHRAADTRQDADFAIPDGSINVDHERSTPKPEVPVALPRRSPEAAKHRTARTTVEVPKTPAHTHDDTQAPNSDIQPSPTPVSNRVFTNMGGALYLLNVLNRPPMQNLMEKAWQTAPNGWYWLYQLGRELDLDPSDALCEFLAERLGFEAVAGLASLPPLPYREDILSLAAQWLSPEELWHPSLIRAPAEFSYTPGHLDLYLDNSQVRLELRLAGLDFNPGWLPWLGTVVTFHFDHFPHLIPQPFLQLPGAES